MIKILVSKGADINVQNNAGATALMYTSGAVDSVDDPETVQALLDNGADPNRFDLDGYTALMYAAEKGLNGATRVLIGARTDTGKSNKNGKTALQLANSNDHKQTAAILNSRR